LDDVLAQVDLRQNMLAIAEVEEAVCLGRTQGNGATDKGSRAADVASLEGQPAVHLNLAHVCGRLVVGWIDATGHGFLAALVTPGGCGHADALVRALGVVDLAPGVEGRLCRGQIGQGVDVQDFGLEGAMEALVLALGLGMVGPAMDHADAQVHQPQAQRCVPLRTRGFPWRAIVGEDAPRQAVAGEHPLQASVHGGGLFVGAGADLEREARVIVQHRQRVAAALFQSKMALEVHLPQIVGSRVLEALEVAALTLARAVQQTMSADDLGDRRGRWRARPARQYQLLAQILLPPQAGCARRTARTRASIAALVQCGLPSGRRERSRRPKAPSAANRLNHLYAVAELISHNRHSSRMFDPGITARPQNSSR
jgi:uracil-DNA glycosylase